MTSISGKYEKGSESVCECVINLLSENPEDEDVVAIFRGQESINDVRTKMGLEPDVLPDCDQKMLLDPYSYAMELGDLLTVSIIDGMVHSESEVERNSIQHFREDHEAIRRKYCGIKG